MAAISDTSGVIEPVCLEDGSIVEDEPALGIFRNLVCCIGVVQDDLLLTLVVDERGQSGLVGIQHGDDPVLSIEVEHPVLGVNAVAVAADIGAALPVAFCQIQFLYTEGGQIPGPVHLFPEAGRSQRSSFLQNGQFLPDIFLHVGPGSKTPADHADVGIFIVVDDVLDVTGQSSLVGLVQSGDEVAVTGDGRCFQESFQGLDHRI